MLETGSSCVESKNIEAREVGPFSEGMVREGVENPCKTKLPGATEPAFRLLQCWPAARQWTQCLTPSGQQRWPHIVRSDQNLQSQLLCMLGPEPYPFIRASFLIWLYVSPACPTMGQLPIAGLCPGKLVREGDTELLCWPRKACPCLRALAPQSCLLIPRPSGAGYGCPQRGGTVHKWLSAAAAVQGRFWGRRPAASLPAGGTHCSGGLGSASSAHHRPWIRARNHQVKSLCLQRTETSQCGRETERTRHYHVIKQLL